MAAGPDVKAFGQQLGHEFREPLYAWEALTHSSLVNEPAGKDRRDNTRCEYIGDAVIELAVRAVLARKFPKATSGQIDPVKQRLVEEVYLANAARHLGLARFLQRGGSNPPDSDALLAQLFEACIGAVMLDDGFDKASQLVERHISLPSAV